MNHWQCQEPADLHRVLPKDQLIHLERGWAANEDSSQQLPLVNPTHSRPVVKGPGVGEELAAPHKRLSALVEVEGAFKKERSL